MECSVIGKTLFLIYINDLPEVVKNSVKMFADDAKIFSKVNNIEDASNLQTDINSLLFWSEKWQLTFNKKSVNTCTLEKKQMF